MKRYISILLAAVLCLSLCACADSESADKGGATGSAGLEYSQNSDGSYTVTGVGSCTDEQVIIPQYYKGALVTYIAADAFREYEIMKSVTVPESVAKIGDDAFWGCRKLEAVYITDLEAWCRIYFENYASNPLNKGAALYLNGELLTDLVIPSGMVSIGDFVFVGCNSLTSVTIPDSVTEIGAFAFSDCDSLTSVNIPDSVNSIGSGAFKDCDSLTSVTIPDSVTSIGSGALQDCTSLTSVTIPDGVTEIEMYVFNGCESLTSVTIPDSVTKICGYAFYNCDSLTSIYFEGTLEQWEALMYKSSDWLGEIDGTLTIYCTDGEIK